MVKRGMEQFQLAYSFPFTVIKICGASAPFQTVLSIHTVLAFEAVSVIQMAKFQGLVSVTPNGVNDRIHAVVSIAQVSSNSIWNRRRSLSEAFSTARQSNPVNPVNPV